MRALEQLVDIFTETGNRSARKSFTRFLPATQHTFALDLPYALKWIDADRDSIEAEISLLCSIRLLWTLVPSRLFETPNPDYERLVEHGYRSVFQENPEKADIRRISIIFRRLRASYLKEAVKTSLDLENPKHAHILAEQCGRCAVCGYKFSTVAQWQLEEPNYLMQEAYKAKDEEITINKYFRRPELDHIIPHAFGGDDESNWQILCKTCNGGKSDALSWLNQRGWIPPSRVADTMKITSSMRYACLVRHEFDISEMENDNEKMLRIFRLDNTKLITANNLKVEYC